MLNLANSSYVFVCFLFVFLYLFFMCVVLYEGERWWWPRGDAAAG